MHLEVVTHCWRYARLLSYQLASFIQFPPDFHHLTISVFFCPDDVSTVKVLEHFGKVYMRRVQWSWRSLDHDSLANRAIGRNQAALSTEADWVWFCDADYYVLPGGLDQICKALSKQDGPLCYPAEILATTYEAGAAMMQMVQLALPSAVWHPRAVNGLITQKFSKAIGGVQFAKGDVCREKGYLNHKPKWLRPYAGNWQPDVEDRRFRVTLGTPGQPIDCPGVLVRIRHAERGGPGKVVDF